MIRQRKGKDTQIAFGPFLAIAGWLALIFGHDVVDRYLGLFAVPADRRCAAAFASGSPAASPAARPRSRTCLPPWASHHRHRSARPRGRRARHGVLARDRRAFRRRTCSPPTAAWTARAARTRFQGPGRTALARAAHASGHPRS